MDEPGDRRFVGDPYPAVLEPVYIHDNYFHDNYQGDPYDGYGVVASGTHVLIEHNVFNGFFHAIAADGCPGSGYRAYRNLVLERTSSMTKSRPSTRTIEDRTTVGGLTVPLAPLIAPVLAHNF